MKHHCTQYQKYYWSILNIIKVPWFTRRIDILNFHPLLYYTHRYYSAIPSFIKCLPPFITILSPKIPSFIWPKTPQNDLQNIQYASDIVNVSCRNFRIDHTYIIRLRRSPGHTAQLLSFEPDNRLAVRGVHRGVRRWSAAEVHDTGGPWFRNRQHILETEHHGLQSNEQSAIVLGRKSRAGDHLRRLHIREQQQRSKRERPLPCNHSESARKANRWVFRPRISITNIEE